MQFPFRGLPVFPFALALLAGCAAGPPPVEDPWTLDHCIGSGGLVVETRPPKCRIGEEEHPLEATNMVPQNLPAGSEAKEADLSDLLIERGIDVEEAWDIEDPLLGESGKTILVGDEFVFLFFFETQAEAKAQAASLSREGKTLAETYVDWGADALYVQSGRVIAVYVGEQQAVIDLLKEAEQGS